MNRFGGISGTTRTALVFRLMRKAVLFLFVLFVYALNVWVFFVEGAGREIPSATRSGVWISLFGGGWNFKLIKGYLVVPVTVLSTRAWRGDVVFPMPCGY